MTDTVEFRRLVDALPAGAYTCNLDGHITYFNSQAVKIWGRTPTLNSTEECFSGAVQLFTADGTPHPLGACWMARTLQTGIEYAGKESIIGRADGTRLVILEHTRPLYDDSHTLVGAINVMVDITHRKQAEEILRAANVHKDDFLALVAHELLNPLAPMRNALHILYSDKATKDMRLQARDIMSRQVNQMVRLVNDLLDISRIKEGKIELRKERINLRDVIGNAVEISRPLIDERKHTLTVELPEMPVCVDADMQRLSQVVSNLLNNAAKYTDKGGHIHILLEQKEQQGIIRIRDTGIGISKEMAPLVFKKFFQTQNSRDSRHGGLGIGLMLVRKLVEMHGGTAEMRSEGLNKGSEFSVVFPVPAGAVIDTVKEEIQERIAPTTSSLRVLMVDDNEVYAKMMGYTLELMGHDFRVAHNAEDAIAIAREYEPDVALLDIGLPGINGYQLCQIMQREPACKKTIFVAQTGWGQMEHRKLSSAAGFKHHLVKPVHMTVLERLFSTMQSQHAVPPKPTKKPERHMSATTESL